MRRAVEGNAGFFSYTCISRPGNKALRNYNGDILLWPYARRGRESDVALGGWILIGANVMVANKSKMHCGWV